jgi:hypothetical protein
MARLTKEQKALKARLITKTNFTYTPPEWGKKFWSRATKDVYLFIGERMGITEDETEYYTCMVYLRRHIPDSELLVEWADSPNRARMTATYVDPEGQESITYERTKAPTTKKLRKAKHPKAQHNTTESIQILTCIPTMEILS